MLCATHYNVSYTYVYCLYSPAKVFETEDTSVVLLALRHSVFEEMGGRKLIATDLQTIKCNAITNVVLHNNILAIQALSSYLPSLAAVGRLDSCDA